MNLLLMGAPGVGKGTMSRFIQEDYNVVHISTGDMLREAISKKTPIGLKAKEFMDKGELVPDAVIHDLIVDRLSQDDIKQGFLFDGYPRTIAQAEDLDVILSDTNLKLDAIINLNVDDDILIRRITGRRICPKCGKIYNIHFNPSKVEGVCDECGEKLQVRSDDNEESLKVRLNAYHKSTEPIVAYYQKTGLVHNIDADKSKLDVYASLKAVLEAC